MTILRPSRVDLLLSHPSLLGCPKRLSDNVIPRDTLPHAVQSELPASARGVAGHLPQRPRPRSQAVRSRRDPEPRTRGPARPAAARPEAEASLALGPAGLERRHLLVYSTRCHWLLAQRGRSSEASQASSSALLTRPRWTLRWGYLPATGARSPRGGVTEVGRRGRHGRGPRQGEAGAKQRGPNRQSR